MHSLAFLTFKNNIQKAKLYVIESMKERKKIGAREQKFQLTQK